MHTIANPLALVACLFSGIASAEQLGRYAARTISTSAAEATGSEFLSKLIDIKRDGLTCPDGTEAAAKINNRCSYGNYVSDRDATGKCCFVTGQNVFLQSLPGGEQRLGAMYSMDSHTCCSGANEEGTALIQGQCQYGNAVLPVHVDQVTKCCWDSQIGDFRVHMKQYRPSLDIPNMNIANSGHVDAGVCNLGYTIDVKDIRVYGDRVELDVSAQVDCGIYDHTSDATLVVHLLHGRSEAGRISFPITSIGPTINVDVSTMINDDGSVNLHLHVKGTGIISSLDQSFDMKMDDPTMKGFLRNMPLC